MGLFNTLVETYDANAMAVHDFGGKPLAPIAHMFQNVQIELSIDINGNFVNAKEVSKEDAKTIIPVDENSGSRSSGIAAHPYEDNLSYIAGDYSEYVFINNPSKAEKIRKDYEDKFAAYLKEIKKWNSSSYTNAKVNAVYIYICKKRVISDLIRSGLIELENNCFSNKKIAGTDYEKCMVRFRVIGTHPEESWHDVELMKNYKDFYLSEISADDSSKQISLLTGKESIITYKHPKGTVNSDFGAKLLSANDEANFTFKGRFQSAQEAYAIDYISSQKAHHALSWLIQNQGLVLGDKSKRTFLIWAINGQKVDGLWNDIEEDDVEDYYPTTEPEYQQVVMKMVHGKEQKFQRNDRIAYVTLQAATTGRLSITYYGELTSEEYFQRIRKWYTECYWMGFKFNNNKQKISRIVTPNIMQIICCTYGRETSTGRLEVDEKLLIPQFQRFIHCVVDGERIPADAILSILQKASNPLSYSTEHYNRDKVLCTACAMIHKYYLDKGRKISMSLDRNETDRNYLYGRLLAIYEQIENAANYQDAEKSGRETNAIRFQSAYAQHPTTVRKTLEEGLNPYLQKLKPGSKEFYKHEMGQISNMIGIDNSHHALNELYLVGYWAEREELRYSRNNTQKEDM